MSISSSQKTWLLGTLILIGVLVACSPMQTPVPIATATVIASTSTTTATPNTPTAIPPPSSTPIEFSTPQSQVISTILETNIEINTQLTRAIISDLANYLNISTNRVQVVSVENAEWGENTLGCIDNSVYQEAIIRTTLDTTQVEGLRYTLLVGNTIYEYHTENTDRYLRCQEQRIVSDEVLVAVDPLAAEILGVVQALLAEELDLSSRRVQLVNMQPVTWSDTSLGCPSPDQTYTQVDIQGYHIVVTVADVLYVYHSDSNTAYPCPVEQSIIPAN